MPGMPQYTGRELMRDEDRAYLDGWIAGAQRIQGIDAQFKYLWLSGWIMGCRVAARIVPGPFQRGMRDAALSAFGLEE